MDNVGICTVLAIYLLFLPAKFAESKCYFRRNLVVLVVVKLPLTTSAEVPGSTPDHDRVFFPFFFIFYFFYFLKLFLFI